MIQTNGYHLAELLYPEEQHMTHNRFIINYICHYRAITILNVESDRDKYHRPIVAKITSRNKKEYREEIEKVIEVAKQRFFEATEGILLSGEADYSKQGQANITIKLHKVRRDFIWKRN